MGFVYDADYDDFKGNRKRPPSGLAVIHANYPVAPRTKEFLNEVLADFHADTRLFYVHVFMSAKREDDFWVPIPAEVIRDFSRRVDEEKKGLVEAGLMERNSEYGPGRCMTYRVPLPIRNRLLNFEHATASLIRVDPLTGAVCDEPEKSKIYNENRRLWRPPLGAALKTLREGRFNPLAYRLHLERIRTEAARKEQRIRSQSAGMGDDEIQDAVLRAYAQYDVDARCYMALLAQRPRFIDGTVAAYDLAYSPTSTGRISHVKGGLQSCTREAKAAAYSGVPDVRNYDLVSSQASILAAELVRVGMDSSWLEVMMRDGKEPFARRAGVPVDVFKRCLYALCFGAALRFPRGPRGESWSVRQIILDYVSTIPQPELPPLVLAHDVFEGIRAELRPLERVLKKYRKGLEDTWLAPRRRRYGGRWFVVNDAGAVLREEEYEQWRPGDRPKKLASFALQGVEAGFIHALTAQLPDHGVMPIANEHDGLVTIGEVPPGLVQALCEARGTTYLSLEEKPFLPGTATGLRNAPGV